MSLLDPHDLAAAGIGAVIGAAVGAALLVALIARAMPMRGFRLNW